MGSTHRAERLKGNLDVLLLAAVSAGASHGYAIIKRLRERSASVLDLPEGTLYPALHRLETAGSVDSTWDTVSGRRRRVYTITKPGEHSLKNERQEWGAFSGAVDAVLERTSPTRTSRPVARRLQFRSQV